MDRLDVDSRAWRKWQAARQRQQNRMHAMMFPCTPLAIRAALLADVPHLREVMVRQLRPNAAEVTLELHRYTWWALGLMHLIALRRARRVVQQHQPAHVDIRVRCGFVV